MEEEGDKEGQNVDDTVNEVTIMCLLSSSHQGDRFKVPRLLKEYVEIWGNTLIYFLAET